MDSTRTNKGFAGHSLCHDEEQTSLGRRRSLPPDLSTTQEKPQTRRIIGIHDNHDSAKDRLMSGKDNAKHKSINDARKATKTPINGAQSLGLNPGFSRSHGHGDEELSVSDCGVEPSSHEQSDTNISEVVLPASVDKWIMLDEDIELKQSYAQAIPSNRDADTIRCPLPPTSRQSVDVQRELELCRAEIERLSCELAQGSSIRMPSRQVNEESKMGTMPEIATQHNNTEVDDVYDSTTVPTFSVERQMNKNHCDREPAADDVAKFHYNVRSRGNDKRDVRQSYSSSSAVLSVPLAATRDNFIKRKPDYIECNSRSLHHPRHVVRTNSNQQASSDDEMAISVNHKPRQAIRSADTLRNAEHTDNKNDGVSYCCVGHTSNCDHVLSGKTRSIKQSLSKEDKEPYVYDCRPRRSRKSQVVDKCEFQSTDEVSDSEWTGRHLRHSQRRYRRRGNYSSSSDESEDKSYHKDGSKRYMKPVKFNGQTSFETFLVQFNNCSKYNRWNEEDKLAHLRWSLTGSAAQLLWGTDGMTYKQLLKKLQSRFGGEGMEEKFQTELQCRRRQPKESLQELAQDIRRLMMLAYPGDNSRMAERVAREHFIVSLDDSELELKVREKEPQTLDDAVRITQRLEVFKSAVGQSSHTRHRVNRQVTELSNPHNSDNLEERMTKIEQDLRESQNNEGSFKSKLQVKKNKREGKHRACTMTVENKDSWKEDLLKKIRELEAAQQVSEVHSKKISAENDALQKEVGRLRHLEQLRSIPASIDRSNRPIENINRPTPAPKKCFNCNDFGHFIKDCPFPRRQNSEGQRQIDRNTQSLQVNGALSSSSNINHDSYLRVTIENKVYDCLLDTGSEVCLLPKSVVDPSCIRQTKRTLKAANGTTISTLGEASLSMSIGFFDTTVTGLVSDHVSEIMLGIDWLVENRAVWDFKSSHIWLNGHSFLLHPRIDKHRWCRRVILQEGVIIPARSEINVPTTVQFHRLPTSEQDGCWSTEPGHVRTGLHVSRTLLPVNRWTNLPVRVMNVSQEPVELKSGVSIADLHQIEVIGDMTAIDADTTSVRRIESDSFQIPDFIEKLVDGVHDSVSESARQTLTSILMDHVDVFSQSENDLGRTDIITHHIDTASSNPVRQPLRRYPPAHVEAISKHVDNMLSQGIIEPACSPWASNVVLVRKKDGSLRCCIDYRQLNAVTRKDAYPLPRVDNCLDAMASANFFSTFDLRSSYHQVVVAHEDRDKTAFICPRGMYRYKTMPFGLCNAGATFQRLMDVVMTGLHLEVCLVYLDDIILFSKSVDEHLERLIRILDRLKSAGLKLKPEKCSLLQKSVTFLGHVVSGDGISTDPEKIKVVAEWPVPSSVKEVRSFLGLAGYYRRFVKGFADIAAPLHALIKKNQSFHWTDEMQVSFMTLRNALISPPVLAMPNDSDPFILDTDASEQTIGAVLSQVQGGVERVISYASRTLDRREKNYCITRKELLAIVHSLKYFKQYLMGRHFKVRTDHAALTWLRHTPEPVGQQARWLEIMEEFDFKVEYRPGLKHSNADALSRRPCPVKSCACRQGTLINSNQEADQTLAVAIVYSSGPADRHTFATTESTKVELHNGTISASRVDGSEPYVEHWSLEGLRAAQENDKDISCIIDLMRHSTDKPPWKSVALQSRDVKILWNMWPRLQLHNGLLQRRFESPDGISTTWQIVLPTILREEFLSTVHGGMNGGHLARRRTAASVQARAYWPTWSSDLDLFLKRCTPCARYHRGSITRKAPLQTPTVGEVWERVSIDITGPHPSSSRSNRFILTLVDHFSKWAEAIPLRNHTASTIARALMVHVFSRFGAPRQLLSDRGSEFESQLFSQLMQWMEIDKLRTTAFKPSTNGVVERFHRTLNSMLGKVINESQRDWDERLPIVLAAYRATPHGSTGFTPNRLFLGRETRMPIDLMMGLPPEVVVDSQTTEEYVINLQLQSARAYELARNHLKANAERRKAEYDIRVKEEKFKVGDWVWYWYPRRYQSKSAKWQKSYIGPFLVVRLIEPVNCVLQRTIKSKPFVVHLDKLKKCFSPTPASWLLTDDFNDEPNIEERSVRDSQQRVDTKGRTRAAVKQYRNCDP